MSELGKRVKKLMKTILGSFVAHLSIVTEPKIFLFEIPLIFIFVCDTAMESKRFVEHGLFSNFAHNVIFLTLCQFPVKLKRSRDEIESNHVKPKK